MTDDPKKNTEIKDEDLDKVAGGIEDGIHRPGDGDTPTTPVVDKRSAEKI